MMWRLSVAAMAAGLIAGPAAADTKRVFVVDASREFSPKAVRVKVGDSVRWVAQGRPTEPHNVTTEWRLFHSGAETMQPIDYQVAFSAGNFRYFCEVHETEGMVGRVRVPVTVRAAPDGPPFTVQWAARGTKTGNRFDVQYRIGAGVWRNWRRNATARRAVFGANNQPVRVRPGRKYSFRARSQKGTNDRAVSGWSPVRSFTP